MTAVQFSKYERARILGARSLQISMDAPILVRVDDEALSDLNFDPLKIAEIELDSGVLPISVTRPMPKRSAEGLEKVKIDEKPAADKDVEKKEVKEEKRVGEEGEIMELATPEDEAEEQDYEGGTASAGAAVEETA